MEGKSLIAKGKKNPETYAVQEEHNLPSLSVETKLDFVFTIHLASKNRELPVQRL